MYRVKVVFASESYAQEIADLLSADGRVAAVDASNPLQITVDFADSLSADHMGNVFSHVASAVSVAEFLEPAPEPVIVPTPAPTPVPVLTDAQRGIGRIMPTGQFQN